MVVHIGLFLFLLPAFLSIGQVRGQAPCKVPIGAKLDVNWYEKAIRDGMYVLVQSKLEKETPLPEFPKDQVYKSKKSKICIDGMLKINDDPSMNKSMVTFSRYFDTRGDKEFVIVETKPQDPIHNKFRYFGEFSVVVTDNANYVLWFGCLHGIRPTFMVVSTPPTLDEKLKEDLIQKAVDLGLNPWDVSDGTNPFVFQRLKAQAGTCTATHGMEAMAGGMGNAMSGMTSFFKFP